MFKKSEDQKRIAALEKKISYSFKNKDLLRQALRHKSYVHEKKLDLKLHNERLEFLGDAVLELAISELLMKRHPDFSEGDLSKLRASIVNEKQLADLAQKLGLGDYLYLGKGEEQTEGRKKSSLLADAYEAILGGVYLDAGYKKASQVVHHHYNELLKERPVAQFYRDYKTDLQEWSQSQFRSVPRYKLVAEKGPDHDKIFEIELFIRDQSMGKGAGRSKKEAEQEAAKQALKRIV